MLLAGLRSLEHPRQVWGCLLARLEACELSSRAREGRSACRQRIFSLQSAAVPTFLAAVVRHESGRSPKRFAVARGCWPAARPESGLAEDQEENSMIVYFINR